MLPAKTILLFVSVVGIIFFFNCDETTGPSDDNKNIEIKGTWSGIVIFEGDSVQTTYTVNNTTFDVNWGGELMSFKVVKYDNAKNFCILQYTNHPVDEWRDKYGKIGWLNDPTTTIQLQGIDGPKDTAEEAENTTFSDTIATFTKQ